jgi:hypothetical protein
VQSSLDQPNRHLNQLTALLKKHRVESLVLHGGLPKSQRDRVRGELSAPRSGPLAVLAIDKVAGEGLDAPRLDTLFLASPISFKGRVIQQVGRIMRDTQANNKNLVEVHDYLDEKVPLLERMHHKRRRILARRGFTLPDGAQPLTRPSQVTEAHGPIGPQGERAVPREFLSNAHRRPGPRLGPRPRHQRASSRAATSRDLGRLPRSQPMTGRFRISFRRLRTQWLPSRGVQQFGLLDQTAPALPASGLRCDPLYRGHVP